MKGKKSKEAMSWGILHLVRLLLQLALFANIKQSGGSTIVCIFEKDALQWDDDLLQNGRASIETLVRMGMGLGRSVQKP